ncbi:winged helix-turn-helix domain-containing protein [Enterobacter asburiae]|uniref:winged helix-turn-helix domain-containing protein n=1 Tax=Enterobacter asburiae TaxID=61645 RepID=UPI003F57E63A
MRYLIVSESEVYAHHIASVLRAGLETVETQTSTVSPLPGTLVFLKLEAVDAVVLDVSGLSRTCGAAIVRRWTLVLEGNIPLLVVTASDMPLDIPAMVQAGACGVHDRREDVRILRARLQALTLRWQGHSSSVLRQGLLCMDLVTRQVRVRGEAVCLTRMEFSILALLLRYHRKTLHRNDMMLRMYSELPESGGGHVLAVMMGRLRKKLAVYGLDTSLETVRGFGYRLDLGATMPRACRPVVRQVAMRARARHAGWSWSVDAGRVAG